jgi:DNA-binding beta-propeller fold protein YncE
MTARPARIVAVLLVAAAALTGCTATPAPSGSPSPSPVRTGYGGRAITKAAEPGDAPAVTIKPAGRVVALPAGTHPWGVAVSAKTGTVYLAPRHQDALDVVDLRTHAVRVVDAPGSARMIDLASPDGPLLLPAEDKATLYALALPSLSVVSASPTRKQPHQAVVVGDTTFVSEEYGHAVRAIRDGRTVADLPQPVQPGGITAVGGRVAAVDVSTNTLFVYDATTLRLLAALPAGEGPSHVVPVGGTRVAVCDARGQQVLTYDLAGTPRALGAAAVPGRAFWIVGDPDTGTIYAALANTNRIAKLRLDGAGKPVLESTVPTVRNPVSFDMDMTTGTLYVGGYADSQLQIIPASSFPVSPSAGR